MESGDVVNAVLPPGDDDYVAPPHADAGPPLHQQHQQQNAFPFQQPYYPPQGPFFNGWPGVPYFAGLPHANAAAPQPQPHRVKLAPFWTNKVKTLFMFAESNFPRS